VALVVITDSDLPSDGAEERVLEAAGHSVRRAAAGSEAELVDAVSGASALLVQWARIDGRVLDAAPECRVVCRLGVGVDSVDLAAASERGVAVVNNPDYCIEEVAAHALALILDFARGITLLDREVRRGGWSPQAAPQIRRLSAMTAAVIGLGRIGARVAANCAALGLRVLAVDPVASPEAARAAGAELVDLETAFASADVVSLHVPLTEATRGLVGETLLGAMRPNAVLVNTCRGGLVDEAALAAAIARGTIGGAALDVFVQEPLPDDSPLRDAPNVILTPHAAWYSPESLADLPRRAAEQVVEFLAGREVPNVVNPDYRLHERAGTR
jgi:D-3-phosphoglycerate dehydrogenase